MFLILKKHPIASILLLLLTLLLIFHQWVLTLAGSFLIRNDKFETAEAAVVLNTGAELYPRLIEAADLYNNGTVDLIIINGNRKTDILRVLESKGYIAPAPWYEKNLRILEVLGVPRDRVISISAENVYDTVSEAEWVGAAIIKNNINSIVVTTSKSHTRRAGFIWQDQFSRQLTIYVRPAQTDPFRADSWWSSGRQIRWVLAEYGAWFYLFWKKYFFVK